MKSPLSEVTKGVHQRLHREGPFARIASARFDARDVALALALHSRAWRRLLDIMYDAVRSAEAPPDFDPAPDRSVPDFVTTVANARFFRLPHVSLALSGLPQPPPLPELLPFKGAARSSVVVGGLYVFLGAQMGGAHLSRRLQSAGFDRAVPVFRPDPRHEDLWRALCQDIEQSDRRRFAEISGSASHWFESFAVSAGDSRLDNALLATQVHGYTVSNTLI